METACINSRKYWPLLLIILIVGLLSFFLYPLADGLILGTVFAYIGRPIRDMFKSRVRLGSFFATVCIVIPITIILGLGALEMTNQVLWLAAHQGDILDIATKFISDMKIPPWIYDEMKGSLQNIIGVITSIIASIPVFDMGRAISLGSINFIISLPVCYFIMLDGEKLVESLISMLPADKVELHKRYINRIDTILSGVFIGSIYTAMAGGMISAVIFYLFGVNHPFAMASFVFIAGLVPLLTAWAVIVPIAVYRYVTIGYLDALIFFIVSSTLIYLPSELVIRPYLVSSKSTIHPLLVMISFLGGMLVAGLGGFFLAPALMGIIVGVYQVHREDVLRKDDERSC